MFKKVGFILILLWSHTILANTANPASITIHNATGTDCVLKQQLPLYGYILDPIELPTVHFKDQTISYNIRSNAKHREAILISYECGEGMNATIFTDISPFQGMLVSDGYILKANKMHAYFSEEHNLSGRFSDHSPVKVSWRLTR